MLFLASQSPRRKELLSWLEVPFEVKPSGFDESLVESDDPVELVTSLAYEKARAVLGQVGDGLVLGSDCVVVIGNEIIGKATDKIHAREILEKLSGKVHKVVTGVSIIDVVTGEAETAYDTSEVEFRQIWPDEYDKYLELPVWHDKAGAYAVQEDPLQFVADVKGSMTTVIGLPLLITAELLERFGVVVPVDVTDVIYEKLGRVS